MLVTPFTDDYRLNEEALRREVQWAICGGRTRSRRRAEYREFLHMDGPSGTRVFEIVIEETRKRANLSAVAMTSGATTLETLRYAKIAARLGYDAQQVIPPYYWRCGEAEVERHYRMIAESGDLPVVIYHNPALSKFNITPKFAGKLATIPGVVAFKEVLTDLQHLEALYDEVDGRADIYNTFRAMLAGLMLGAAGASSIFSRCPRRSRCSRRTRPGDYKRAEEIQRRLNRCFPRGGEETLGHLGTTRLPRRSRDPESRWAPHGRRTWRPPTAERILKRLPLLNEVI